MGRFTVNKRYNKWAAGRVFRMVGLLLLVVCGYQGFQLARSVRNASAVSGYTVNDAADIRLPDPEASDMSKDRLPLNGYRIIWDRNLFGTVAKRSSAEAVKTAVVRPPEPLKMPDLQLLGTVVSDDVDMRRAVIGKTGGRQAFYREGDAIDGVRIKTILRESVIVSFAEKDRRLSLATGSAGGMPMPPARARELLAASVSTTAHKPGSRSRSVAIDGKALQAYLVSSNESLDLNELKSYKYGRLSGFRIGHVPEGSLLGRIGLRHHDAIVAVNDAPISSPEQVSGLIEKIADGEDIALKVRRRARTYRYRIHIN